ncbi:MAG: TetR family transcriptional regulator [Spirochaetales bacterium]|nr:TetR family transcriptional regulator [Spirochaetales bacterium]
MRSTERKIEIIKAAFELISSAGIQELTIKRIAQAVGVSEAALYRHFSSKASILTAVLDEMTIRRDSTYERAVALSGNARETIAGFFTEQARLFEQEPALTIMLYPEDLFRNDEGLKARIAAIMDGTRARFGGLLSAGIDDGSIRADIDRDAVALALVGGFRLLVSAWRINPSGNSLRQAAQRYVAGVLQLIAR